MSNSNTTFQTEDKVLRMDELGTEVRKEILFTKQQTSYLMSLGILKDCEVVEVSINNNGSVQTAFKIK